MKMNKEFLLSKKNYVLLALSAYCLTSCAPPAEDFTGTPEQISQNQTKSGGELPDVGNDNDYNEDQDQNNDEEPSEGCGGPYVTQKYYQQSVNGVGNTTSWKKITTFDGNRKIVADQTLRVSVAPLDIGSNYAYQKMAFEIGLFKNNGATPVATVILGTDKHYDNWGKPTPFRKGVAVGMRTNQLFADFSSSLGGKNTTYSIGIRNIQTDYMCNYFAGVYTPNSCDATQCFYGNAKYATVFDFHTNSWYNCCGGEMLKINQEKFCGVGTATAPVVATKQKWAVRFYVETDATKCIK